MDHAVVHSSGNLQALRLFQQYKDRFVKNLFAAGFICAAQDSVRNIFFAFNRGEQRHLVATNSCITRWTHNKYFRRNKWEQIF